MMRFSRILLLLCAFACALFAARPMVNDDGNVVEQNSCQLESWGKFGGENRRDFGLWALPSCNVIWNTEITLGGALSRFESERVRGEEVIVAAKKIFGSLEEDGMSFGGAMGNVATREGSEPYIYGIWSSFWFGDLLVTHANLGYRYARGLNHRHQPTGGIGLELSIAPNLWVMSEIFYEKSADFTESNATKFSNLKRDSHLQAGLRFWVLPQKFQIDLTYGRDLERPKNAYASLGIRYLGDAFK